MTHKIISATRFSTFIIVLSVLIISQTAFADSFKLVKDINPGKDSSEIRYMNVGDQLFFWAKIDRYADKQLWTIDNAHGGTIQISNIDYSIYDHMAGVADMAVGPSYFFALRRKSDWGYELWRGTSSGVEKLRDIPNYIHNATTVSALGMYFFVPYSDPDYGRELWVSDGTTSGTMMVKDIKAGVSSSNPYDLIEAGGELYFLVGQSLWKSDGTSNNTRLVRTFDCDCPSSIHLVGVANNTLYIKWGTRIDGVSTSNLWRYETPSGQTSLVKSFTNLSQRRYAYAGIGNTFYFINNTVENPPDARKYGLWKTDGNSDGTVLLKEWNGQWSSMSEQLTPADHLLYFIGGNDDNRELWVSNGTSEGTHQVKDITPDTYTKINYMISMGDTLFFIKDHYPSGKLWISDGTEPGTVETRFRTNSATCPMTLNGQLFFYGNDETTDEYGGELYKYSPSDSVGIIYINNNGNCNNNTPCYATINDGYKASAIGTVIKLCTGFYLEDLIFNENKEIIFSGGWNTDFSENSEGLSTIGGSLIVTGGTTVIEGIVIGGTTTLTKTNEQQFSCRMPESWPLMRSFQD